MNHRFMGKTGKQPVRFERLLGQALRKLEFVA